MNYPRLFLGLGLALQIMDLQANPANPDRMSYLEAMLSDLQQQVAALKEQSPEKVINPSANPCSQNGCDFFITGDLLYWTAHENGLGYAIKANQLVNNDTTTLGNGKWATPHFEGDLGFRVGLGWYIPHDNWDLYFSWLRLHTAAHGHHSQGGTRVLFPTFSDPAYAQFPSEHASAHLNIHFNALQLELGRRFYVGRHLSLRPHIGLSNLWISQHYITKYERALGHPSFFNTVRFRNNFWGIGARGGVYSQWEMRWGFSLLGDIGFSLLYGNFDLKRTTHLNIGSTTKSHIDYALTQARAGMEYALGLQWDHSFAHDLFHLALRFAWEEQIYFGQNQLFNFFDSAQTSLGKVVSANDDLTFQGLTFSVRLDF